jgi:hypothetical protein
VTKRVVGVETNPVVGGATKLAVGGVTKLIVDGGVMNVGFVTLVVCTVLTLLGTERVGTKEDRVIVLLLGVKILVARPRICEKIPGFGVEGGAGDIGGTGVANNRAGGSNFWVAPIDGVDKVEGLLAGVAIVR